MRSLLPGILLLATACLFEPAGARDVESPLLPLAAGTEWRYVQTDSVELGVPPSSPVYRDTVRVLADTLIGRERWSIVANAAPLLGRSVETRAYLRNRADGLYEYLPAPVFVEGSGLALRLFKYPARKGEQSTAIPPSVVTTTDTTIHVSAGEFRTVRYDVGGHTTYFFAPRVGMVKRVTLGYDMIDPSGRLILRVRHVQELESFVRRH